MAAGGGTGVWGEGSVRRFDLAVDSSRRLGPAFFPPCAAGPPGSGGGAVVPLDVPGVVLITTRPTTLAQKRRHFGYWRQVLEADNN